MTSRDILKAIGYDVSNMTDEECEKEVMDIYNQN
jgi:hypothetical protein